MRHFKIVKSEDPDDLEDEVCELINDGWVLRGDLIIKIFYDESDDICKEGTEMAVFYQTLTI
jgi:hypothetical protein